MKNTHTQILFCCKDEPLLMMIQNEFKGVDYHIKAISDGKFTTVNIHVHKIIPVLEDDQILLDGCNAQFESLRYYNKVG